MAAMKSQVSQLTEYRDELVNISNKLNSSLIYNTENSVAALCDELKEFITILNNNITNIQQNASAIDNNKKW